MRFGTTRIQSQAQREDLPPAFHDQLVCPLGACVSPLICQREVGNRARCAPSDEVTGMRVPSEIPNGGLALPAGQATFSRVPNLSGSTLSALRASDGAA